MIKMNRCIELLKNKDYESLSNLTFLDNLVEYQYDNKYLIEYLLELGIHSTKMDDYLIHHVSFVKYYLKYNIIEPLLNCHINVLFKKIDNNLVLDLILDKSDDEYKI